MSIRAASIKSRFAPLRSTDPEYSNEIDVELLTFIERYATNLTRWDLLVFFGENPSTRDNASEIAQNVGRRTRTIQKELDDLVYLGILDAHQNADGNLYELTRLPETRRAVVRFARCLSSDRPPAHSHGTVD